MDPERQLEIEKQLEIISRLREDLEQTRVAYELAKEERRQAMILRADLGPTHPDGNIARALKRENEAFIKFRRALEAFNRCILDGKLPENENLGNEGRSTDRKSSSGGAG